MALEASFVFWGPEMGWPMLFRRRFFNFISSYAILLSQEENGPSMSDILAPALGEDVVEAIVVRWMKKAGEVVRKNDFLVELETDKVSLEIVAQGDGVLTISALEGDTVVSGQKLGSIGIGTFEHSKPDYSKPLPIKPKDEKSDSVTSLRRQRIFIVHGRDNSSLHEVARFVEKLGLEAVVLHEQPNKGRSIINKFQEVASDIAYAVVLMTPDDTGALKGESPKNRARQNVVFELGFFIGRLGADKVCALVAGDIQRPSDFEAVVYVPFGESTSWRTQLAKELHDAGVDFDPKKAW